MKVLARAACALVSIVACLALAPAPAFADRMALWQIVALKCLRHLAKAEAPVPCESVDMPKGEDTGVAFLKDLNGVAQMLAIPTRRLTGIEDPLLLQPDTRNYFADGWAARSNVEFHLKRKLPREAIGVTINSSVSRSQDQFHLHVDCMDPEVAAALAEYSGSLDDTWRPVTIALKGRHYWARRLDSADLANASPFRLLAEGIEGAKGEMGLWSLAAVGASFSGQPGFILLADHAELAGGGHAEDLQDHDCAIARPHT